MDYLIPIVITGFGATAFMDLWGVIRKQLLGVAPPNYSLVGRWIGHMQYGRFRHDAIAKAAPIVGEQIIGWTAHYLIGISFAGLLIGIFGLEWAAHPTLLPAITVGIGTVVAPFLLMQPGMGAGIIASRTPSPRSARLQSLITHAVFGMGLYVAGWAAHWIY